MIIPLKEDKATLEKIYKLIDTDIDEQDKLNLKAFITLKGNCPGKDKIIYRIIKKYEDQGLI